MDVSYKYATVHTNRTVNDWLAYLYNDDFKTGKAEPDLNGLPDELKEKDIWLTLCDYAPIFAKYLPKELCKKSTYIDIGTKNIDAIAFMPKKQRYYLYADVCVAKPELCDSVPKGFQTKKFYTTVCSRNGSAITDVPRKYQDENVRIAACKNDPFVIAKMDVKDLTEKICLTSVSENGEALSVIPPSKRTPDVCCAAYGECCIRYGEEHAMEHLEEFLPKEYVDDVKTNHMWMMAIQYNPDFIKKIPEEERLRNVCYSAVSQKSELLCEVPDKYRNKDLYAYAYEHDANAIKYIPKALQDTIVAEYKELHSDKIKVSARGSEFDDLLERENQAKYEAGLEVD